MRVLLVTHGYPPNALGGTELYVEELARALTRMGDQVHVFAREADTAREEFSLRESVERGVPVTWVNNTFRRSRSFSDAYRNEVIRAHFARVLETLQPDVVHIHHLTCLSTDLVFEARRRGIPTHFTLHDFWMLCQRGQLLDHALQRCSGPTPDGCAQCLRPVDAAPAAVALGRGLPSAVKPWLARALSDSATGTRLARARLDHVKSALSAVDALWAPSETVLNAFVQQGIPREKLSHHPLGLDTRSFHKTLRQRSGPLNLGFVGTLMVSKAPHLLLEAYARLPPGSASVTLCGPIQGYHGDESYRRRLEPLLALPGVHHRGVVDREQMPEVLSALDVLVVPSVWLENSPLVIREAFASGAPVVASNLGGMREAVREGQDGLLFTAGDVSALELTLRRLLDEPDLLPSLSAQVPSVRTIEEDAAQTRDRYQATLPHQRARTGLKTVALVLNYKTPEQTVLAVQSALSQVSEVRVVDNGGDSASLQRLRQLLPEGTQVLALPTNLGFSGGMNAGTRWALEDGAENILWLNSDARLKPGAVAALQQALMNHPRAAIAGPTLWNTEQPARVESCGLAYQPWTGRMQVLGAGESRVRTEAPKAVDAVTGCVMLLQRRVFEEVGFLRDEFFYSFEDLELCLRARAAGLQTLWVPDAEAEHLGSGSIGRSSAARMYYATRNHLLLNQEFGKGPGWTSLLRTGHIALLNLAHSVRQAEVPRWEAVRGWAEGAADHWRGRYGSRGPTR